MKIFLLTLNDDEWTYDCTSDVVVVAEDENSARSFIFGVDIGGDQDNKAWLDPNRCSCQEISMQEKRIVLESFHAG